MTAADCKAATKRNLTSMRGAFMRHPQRNQMCVAVYVFAVLVILLVANLAFDVSPGLLAAYALGFAAIGVSSAALVAFRAVHSSRTLPSSIQAHFTMVSDEPVAVANDKSEIIIEEPAVSDASHAEPAPILAPEVEAALSAIADGEFQMVEELPEQIDDVDQRPDTWNFLRTPVVTLPQRRLHIIRGDLFGPNGERVGASAEMRFAHALAFIKKNKFAADRDIMIPLPISALDSEFLFDAADILQSDPAVAGRIIFELPSNILAINHPDLPHTLETYRDEGIRFATTLDRIVTASDFIIHGNLWSQFQYLLIPAPRIIKGGENVFRLFQSLGVSLIATEVEANEQIPELLDFAVPFAAGSLFETAKPATKPAHLDVQASSDPVPAPTPKKPKRAPAKRAAPKRASKTLKR